MRHVIPYREAIRLKAQNPQARWPAVAQAFAGEVWPEIKPSFRIARGEAVFTIGSCFARNIERHLQALGCSVPMLDFRLPPEEWHGDANSAMNKFHPPSFRQALEWTAAIHDRDGRVGWDDCAAFAFDCGDGGFIDLDMGATTPVSHGRLIERRQHVYDIFSRVFSAGCLMMTPGLIEAWRDRDTGLYLHEAPGRKALLAGRDRWELEILPYQACLEAMLAAIDVVRARNPAVRILITTSPVPMAATFSGQDVRTANTYSKSVLRAVCGAVTVERPMVDYFPSYESVTLSFPEGVWNEDRLHIASGFIGKIVERMLDGYLEGVEDGDRAFQRARNAIFNKDYAQAEAAARQALTVSPAHVEARIVLGEALMRQNRIDEAERELRPMLDAHPDRADLWFLLARALARVRERRAEAAELAAKGAFLPSVTLTEFRGVAALVRQNAAPRTAERIARRAVELYPLHVEARQLLAEVLIDQGRRREAIAVLREAVKLRRARAADHFKLAELLAAEGEGAAADEALSGALAYEPTHPGAMSLRRTLRDGTATEASVVDQKFA